MVNAFRNAFAKNGKSMAKYAFKKSMVKYAFRKSMAKWRPVCNFVNLVPS